MHTIFFIFRSNTLHIIIFITLNTGNIIKISNCGRGLNNLLRKYNWRHLVPKVQQHNSWFVQAGKRVSPLSVFLEIQ